MAVSETCRNTYEQELAGLATTYAHALDESVEELERAITGASESSIIAVGSGGSFTVATLLCSLHEAYTGHVSRPSTPLELICNPTLASSSPVFLISAEGRNPDIVEALQRARRQSARPIHVLTNREESPLTDSAGQLRDVTCHTFPLSRKDGYLATQSLLYDAILVARIYSDLDSAKGTLPLEAESLRVGADKVSQWVDSAEVFADAVHTCGAITVVYSPLLRPVAADIESKVAESSLLHCQSVDLRSYAHGRHLWLSERPEDCAILALTEPMTAALWQSMKAEFPVDIPTFEMALDGANPAHLLGGIVAEMRFLARLAKHAQKDIGAPDVLRFGRNLYYLGLSEIIPRQNEKASDAVESKLDVLGSRWPSRHNYGRLSRSARESREQLDSRTFRAIVFDYDGTLSNSRREQITPPAAILDHLTNLVEHGIAVGIASGRGGSVQELLTSAVSPQVLSNIYLGLYSGGWLASATEHPLPNSETSEFLSHVTRLVVQLRENGVPIDSFRTTHPYQVSIRFRDGLRTDDMWFVIADALRQAGLDTSSIVRSKHSIDVLQPGVTKAGLVSHILREQALRPYEVLTIGDQGAWPGNDASLLEHRFSLSVDSPSRRLDRGWKFAPPHKRQVDATLWYLERFRISRTGQFQTSFSNP